MTNLTILGGGNLAHVCAGFLGAQSNVQIRILTRRPSDWAQELVVTDPSGTEFRAPLERVTSDPAEALTDSDLILVALPGFAIRETLENIRPHLAPTTLVGSVVANTGFFMQALELLPPSNPLFGFQRVPFISRTTSYGHTANLLGYKPKHKIAVERAPNPSRIVSLLESLFKAPFELLENHYAVTLSNSNPLLHTARLYTLFEKGDVPYEVNPFFYADWNDAASKLLILMDAELRTLLDLLHVSRESVVPILEYYESTDAASLTRKIRSIPAFRGISSPMKPEGDHFRMDLQSRYFTEDFFYGLKSIYDLMIQHALPAPVISQVYRWGLDLLSKS